MTHYTNNAKNNIHTDQKMAHDSKQLLDVPAPCVAKVKVA